MTIWENYMKRWLLVYMMEDLYYDPAEFDKKDKVETDLKFEKLLDMFDAYEEHRKEIMK